ncbi:NucA/NucB deoxyribonuclease domain-containing protein [Lentzea aerocolonigenes]|uniref:NucA/NucB deoxyribonuclease domain-containing protein n=1 Tax=Lentzea aerocolonigenes TaxID=68170 RepID=UPI0009DFDB74
MKRSKLRTSLLMLAFAASVVLTDVAAASPAPASAAQPQAPVLPTGVQTGDAPATLTMGPSDKPPTTLESELDKLVERAPKGEALYNPAYDKRFVIVNDPKQYNEKTGEYLPASAIGYEECEGQAGDNGWWFKDKFNMCSTSVVAVRHMELVNGVYVQIGTSYFDVTMIATSTPATQDIEFGFRMRFKDLDGRSNEGLISLNLGCNNADPLRTSTCSADSHTPAVGVGFTVQQWKTTYNGFPFGFTVRTSTTAVPQDKYKAELRGYFAYGFVLTGASTGAPPNSVTLKSTPLRCDSASYVYDVNGKCVFHAALSSLQMSASHADMGESASFIRDAQAGGPRIAPPGGKPVPGAYQGTPLTRLYKDYDDGKLIKASRRKIKRTCKEFFTSNYTKHPTNSNIKMECDEYPFATTYQNSAAVKPDSIWGYAVRPVSREHNGAAGRYYGAWMSRDRILDGDPFYVIITP